jgi:hypothetical protein
MSLLSAVKTDLESLAKGAAAGFESLMAKIEADVAAAEARVMKAVEDRFASLRAELVGTVEAVPSPAVADLQKAVAAIEPAPAATPAIPAPAAASPNAPAPGATA